MSRLILLVLFCLPNISLAAQPQVLFRPCLVCQPRPDVDPVIVLRRSILPPWGLRGRVFFLPKKNATGQPPRARIEYDGERFKSK